MSSVRKETERTKFIQDKCQTLLTQMLRDEDNKYCVDCDAKGPRWASWNLGVFLCIRCAGIHRNLGVHISRVRSVNLDSWTPEQVMSLQNMGNSRARAIYEAQLPDGFRRPQTDSALESFVRAKYEHKKYLAREYVPTAPAVANWDKEIDEEMERQKRSKKKTTGSLGASISTLPTEKKSLSVKSPNAITLTKPTQSPKSTRIISQPPPVTSASADLLGLCSSPAPNTASITNGTKSEAEEAIGDIFSSFISGPTPMTAGSTTSSIPLTNTASSDAKKTSELGGMSLAKQEEDFFNQVAPTEQEKGKMTRDSIMALYAKTPSNNTYTDAFNNGAGAGFKQFNGVQSGPNAFHQPQSLQQQQQPSQMVGFSGIPASNQFSNAQLLSQLGGVGTSSMPGAVFGINPMNGNQSNQQQPPPQMFANFGSTPQQAQHQLPSFAQFPPMSGASATTFPNAATASNGFGSNTMRAAQQPGLNAEFANLNMWQ